MDRFIELLKLDVNNKLETRKSGDTELSYLSWSFAWSEFKKVYPDANYNIKTFFQNNTEITVPYMYDENTGYMVMTEVSAGGLTYEMWLPVLDGNNKPMKNKPYTITTKKGKEISVQSASMFDINKALMRCLVKNLAMFGLGLYIYAGEDLPDNVALTQEEKQDKQEKEKKSLKEQILNCNSDELLTKIYRENKSKICSSSELLDLITKRGNELKG